MHFYPGQVNVDIVVPVIKIFDRDKQSHCDQKTEDDGISCRLALLIFTSILEAPLGYAFHFLFSNVFLQQRRLTVRPHAQIKG